MNTIKNELMTVGLENMEFYAYHGCYTEEKRLGRRFEVSVEMTLRINDFIAALPEEKLELTSDYSRVYAIISEIINGDSANLMETLAIKINQKLLASFPHVDRVKTKIAKLHPPLSGLCQKSYVVLASER